MGECLENACLQGRIDAGARIPDLDRDDRVIVGPLRNFAVNTNLTLLLEFERISNEFD